MPNPILQVNDVHKRFPGVHALRGVELEVMPGEIHALLGENGAGKSTLIKVIAGVYRPDSGDIVFEGEKIVCERVYFDQGTILRQVTE